jgi:hypothetical protein
MTWGIKVSKPGIDVKTATPDQLVMNSEYLSLKIAHSALTTGDGTYTHNLGYAPAFIVSNPFFDDDEIWGFSGQFSSPSAFEAPFYSSSTEFYFWGVCRYFLFYQETL